MAVRRIAQKTLNVGVLHAGYFSGEDALKESLIIWPVGSSFFLRLKTLSRDLAANHENQ